VEADLGPGIARRVARHLVVFMQRPGGQAQFSVRLQAELRRAFVRHVGVTPDAYRRRFLTTRVAVRV
jgi:transcriptional regulator GlxA family with amidase domain